MGKYDIIILAGLIGGAFILFTEQGQQLLNSLKSTFNNITSSSGYAGAYQVAAKNLPYDPNNYYLPPRDQSILP